MKYEVVYPDGDARRIDALLPHGSEVFVLDSVYQHILDNHETQINLDHVARVKTNAGEEHLVNLEYLKVKRKQS